MLLVEFQGSELTERVIEASKGLGCLLRVRHILLRIALDDAERVTQLDKLSQKVLARLGGKKLVAAGEADTSAPEKVNVVVLLFVESA